MKSGNFLFRITKLAMKSFKKYFDVLHDRFITS